MDELKAILAEARALFEPDLSRMRWEIELLRAFLGEGGKDNG